MAVGGWVDWAQGEMSEAAQGREWAGQRLQGGGCQLSTVAPEGAM